MTICQRRQPHTFGLDDDIVMSTMWTKVFCISWCADVVVMVVTYIHWRVPRRYMSGITMAPRHHLRLYPYRGRCGVPVALALMHYS